VHATEPKTRVSILHKLSSATHNPVAAAGNVCIKQQPAVASSASNPAAAAVLPNLACLLLDKLLSVTRVLAGHVSNMLHVLAELLA
jgi:hypothetical protein